MKNALSMIISLLLASGIVGGGIYIMSRSTSDISAKAENTDIPENDITYEPQTYKKDRSYGTNLSTQDTSEVVIPGSINKCQSGGKITYSDKGCKSTERQVVADIRETSGGFVSPDQQTIANTRAQIRAEIQRPGFAAMAGESTPATSSNTQGQCYYLKEEIKSIDNASNVGQTSWSQEQLRLRRLDVRNRMYRLGC